MSVFKKWRCLFYEDSEASTPITVINLGDVWDGEDIKMTVYIKNDEAYPVKNIHLKIDNGDIEFDYPPALSAMEISPIIIYWKPSVNSIKLDSEISITGDMIV